MSIAAPHPLTYWLRHQAAPAARLSRWSTIPAMDFTKRLRPGVQRGEITCSIRIWQRPQGQGRQSLLSTGVGQIEVDSIEPIELADITPELARESGFNGVVDLLEDREAWQRHERVPGAVPLRSAGWRKAQAAKTPARKTPNGDKQRKRIAKIVEGLPEGEAKPDGRHMSLEVRKKRFGWFLVDHHGDGRVALNCKASARDARHPAGTDAGAFSRAEVPRQQGLGRYLAGPAQGSTGLRWSWRCAKRTCGSRRRSSPLSSADVIDAF